MHIVEALAVTVVAVAAAVTAMLLVRRRAPEGGYFTDGDRAAGVFGVLATGFAILLGFIVFLAFESYDASRSGAETEAVVVAQQIETAQLFEGPVPQELTGELVCYARVVAGPEWDAMEDGTIGDRLNPWGVELFRTLETIAPESASAQAAYAKWLDQTSERETGRQDRIHGASGVIPSPLWWVLYAISAIIFAYMLLFADRGERAFVQAMLIGSVTAVIVMLLLLLGRLDQPFAPGSGSLRPTAMERTLRLIDEQLAVMGDDDPLPCDADGGAV